MKSTIIIIQKDGLFHCFDTEVKMSIAAYETKRDAEKMKRTLDRQSVIALGWKREQEEAGY